MKEEKEDCGCGEKKEPQIDKHLCPFCGKKFKMGGLKMHIKHCKMNPDRPLTKKDLPPKETHLYACPFCGKDCKREIPLDTHMKFCEKNPANIGGLDFRIKEFFDKLGGRTVANKQDLERMHGMFQELYPQSKLHYDPNCTPCVSHIFNKLKQHYNKIK